MTKRGEAEGARLSPGVLRGEGGRKKVHSHRDPSFHSVSGGPFRCTPHSQERPLEELEGRRDAETGPGPEQTKRHAGHPWGLGWTHLPRAHEEVLAPTVLCPFRASPQRSGDSYSPGDEAGSAVPSSRGVSEPVEEVGTAEELAWWCGATPAHPGASLCNCGLERAVCSAALPSTPSPGAAVSWPTL